MDSNALKLKLAAEVAQRVQSGQVLGIGTGTTVDLVIDSIGQRLKSDLSDIHAIVSSYETAWRCEAAGIQVLHSGYAGPVNWGFDGADSVDSSLRLIKGGGGALLREKIVALRSATFTIIVDQSKMVSSLLDGAAVPIEVIPEALPLVQGELLRMGVVEAKIRQAQGKHGPIITESGNLILDARFPAYPDELEPQLKQIVGVVESGLFFGYADEVWIAGPKGVEKRAANRAHKGRTSP
ncbi:MAG: ribose-5-phosphate isomerase RpiA [Bdellovibrionota bacterium]|nr:MAG: ribose-5-phosphate isomerase RpiA [Bdellovibrionota bacterium]